jgi:hypothetical protein
LIVPWLAEKWISDELGESNEIAIHEDHKKTRRKPLFVEIGEDL